MSDSYFNRYTDYGFPQVIDADRKLIPRHVTKFRGVDVYSSVPRVDPHFALDCLNVIVSDSGALEKLRIPVQLTALVTSHSGVPITNFYDFQQGNLVRQILAFINDGAVGYFLNDGSYAFSLIESSPGNIGIWSPVTSNNIAFLANPIGSRMRKWTGTAFQRWGIDAPTVAPVYISSYNITPIGASRTSNVTTIYTSSPFIDLVVGDKVNISGVVDVSFNGGPFTITSLVLSGGKPIGFTFAQTGADAVSGNGTVTFVGGITVTTGRQYGYAYGNSVTGHVGSAFVDLDGTTGPFTSQAVKIEVPPPTDSQVDTIWLFATLDGGGDYFLVGNTGILISGLQTNTVTGKLVIADATADEDLNTAFRSPLINDPPFPGRYLSKWEGRIFVFNVLGSPQDILYSGYERIFLGRPEESFPPYNRLRLSTGADEIRGGGVIQAGVVAFSKSNEMFMFRGIVEDVTISAPLLFSSILEQLPWSLGCLSHPTIASTPYGLIWWASDKSVQLFNGAGDPIPLGRLVQPILNKATSGQEQSSKAVYFNYADRDWYALLFATGVPPKSQSVILPLGIFRNNGDTAGDVTALVPDPTPFVVGDRIWVTGVVDDTFNGGPFTIVNIGTDTHGKLLQWKQGYRGDPPVYTSTVVTPPPQKVRPSAFINPDSVLGGTAYHFPAAAFDGNTSTQALAGDLILSSGFIHPGEAFSCRWGNLPDPSPGGYASLTLRVDSGSVDLTAEQTAAAKVEYSLDGGTTWTTIYNNGNHHVVPSGQTIIDSVVLLVSQDLTKVVVRASASNPGINTGSSQMSVRDIWVDATFTPVSMMVQTGTFRQSQGGQVSSYVVPNNLLIFDLDPDPNENVGVFPFSVQADDIQVVEDRNGIRRLMISAGGLLYEFKVVFAGQSGLPYSVTPGSGTLAAYWKSAYFGMEHYDIVKIFRWGRLVTSGNVDGNGNLLFSVSAALVNDESNTLVAPVTINPVIRPNGKFTLNRKSKKCSITVNFPPIDQDATLVSLSLTYKSLSER